MARDWSRRGELEQARATAPADRDAKEDWQKAATLTLELLEAREGFLHSRPVVLAVRLRPIENFWRESQTARYGESIASTRPPF